MFQSLSEEGTDDEGMPTNIKLINKGNCKEMAKKVLKKEKNLSEEELVAYMKQNFNRIWKEHDTSEN